MFFTDGTTVILYNSATMPQCNSDTYRKTREWRKEGRGMNRREGRERENERKHGERWRVGEKRWRGAVG